MQERERRRNDYCKPILLHELLCGLTGGIGTLAKPGPGLRVRLAPGQQRRLSVRLHKVRFTSVLRHWW
jgi:hypothetical protein